jgi:methyl-accepting chemotaxis protein
MELSAPTEQQAAALTQTAVSMNALAEPVRPLLLPPKNRSF